MNVGYDERHNAEVSDMEDMMLIVGYDEGMMLNCQIR